MSVKDLIIKSNSITVDDILDDDLSVGSSKSNTSNKKNTSKSSNKKTTSKTSKSSSKKTNKKSDNDKSDKSKKYIPKDYTNEEKKEMLEDYLLIKNNDWYSIPLGSHVRYEKKDGSP